MKKALKWYQKHLVTNPNCISSSFKLLAGSRTKWMVLLLWCRHSYNEDHCLSLQSLLSSPAAASCSRHDDDDQDDQDYNANDHHHLHVLPPVFPLESCSLRRFRYTSTQFNVGLTWVWNWLAPACRLSALEFRSESLLSLSSTFSTLTLITSTTSPTWALASSIRLLPSAESVMLVTSRLSERVLLFQYKESNYNLLRCLNSFIFQDDLAWPSLFEKTLISKV